MRESEFIKEYNVQSNSQTHHIVSDDEVKKDLERLRSGGYKSMMSTVDKTKKLAWKHFYEFYKKEHPEMTDKKIDDKCLEIGVSDYNDQIGEKCNNYKDVFKSIKEYVPSYTLNDAFESMKDRGLMILLREEFKLQNAVEFLEHIGVEAPDE